MIPWLSLTALAEPARVAVIVGANRAPPGRATLRYAHDDARAVAETLIAVGGFEPADVHVLADPTPAEVLGALSAARASELAVFYYSGHADDGALFPGGKPLPIDQVRAALAAVDVPLRVGVLDACRGGEWTGAKGLVPIAEFPVPTAIGEGIAWVAASSGGEDAHESSAFAGSIFTHHWVSGLRGPADADADGTVTLDESFAHARTWTVRDSTIELGRAQHPSFHYDLRGRDAVVLADLRATSTVLTVRADRDPITVHALAAGAPVAELAARADAWRLALPPGRYLLRREVGGVAEIAEVELFAGHPEEVEDDAFSPVQESWLVAAKGDEARSTGLLAPRGGQVLGQIALGRTTYRWRTDGTPLAPAFSEGYLAQRITLDVALSDLVFLSVFEPSLGLHFGQPGKVEGLFVAGVSGGALSTPGDWLVDLGARFAIRAPLSDHLALHATGTADGNAQFGTIDTPADDRVALGAGVHLGGAVSFYPAVGAGYRPQYDLGHITFGSVLEESYRALPLVRVHLANGFALDGHLAFDWTPETGALDETMMLGLTFATRKDPTR